MAAEGITLSGVRKDEDCKLTELWRNPFGWVPKVQNAKRESLRQKDKEVSPSQLGYFCVLADRFALKDGLFLFYVFWRILWNKS